MALGAKRIQSAIHVDTRLLWPATVNLWRVSVTVVGWSVFLIVAIWLLQNMTILLQHQRWHVLDRQVQIEACYAFSAANGLELRWSDAKGCH